MMLQSQSRQEKGILKKHRAAKVCNPFGGGPAYSKHKKMLKEECFTRGQSGEPGGGGTSDTDKEVA